MADRPVVPDLAQPEPIRPTSIPSDHYTAPPPVPVDQNNERLVASLNLFGTNLQRYIQTSDLEEKKAHLEEMNRRFSMWQSSTTKVDQMKAFHSGAMDVELRDPIFKKVAQTYYGQLAAQELAAGLDTDRLANKIGYGRTEYNPDKDILERARPYVERFRGDSTAMTAFNKALDHIRVRNGELHQEAFQKMQIETNETVVSGKMRDLFTASVDAGQSPEQVNVVMREAYKSFASRVMGGSTDLRYNRIDELVLDQLENLAHNPKYAVQAMAQLGQVRESVDGTNRLGSLAGALKHEKQVERILHVGRKTMGEEERQARIADIKHANDVMVASAPGAIHKVTDVDEKSAWDGSAIKYSREDQLKDAASRAITEARATYRDPYPVEFKATVANNLKHEVWINTLKNGSEAALAANDPQAFKALAEQYERVVQDGGMPYWKEHLGRDARDRYELYMAQIKDGKSSEQAMAGVQIAMQNEATMKDPEAFQGRQKEVDKAIGDMDFRTIFSEFPKVWKAWGGGVNNESTVKNEVKELASVYMRVNGMGGKKAVELALDRYKSSAVYVNGQALRSMPGVVPSDRDHFESILDNVYRQHKTWLNGMGIKSSSDLSVRQINGHFIVSTAENGTPLDFIVRSIPEQPELIDGTSTIKITLSDLMDARAMADIKARKDPVAALKEQAAKDAAKVPTTGKPTLNVTSGYKPPGDETPDLGYSMVEMFKRLRQVQTPLSTKGNKTGEGKLKLRWPDTKGKPPKGVDVPPPDDSDLEK